MRLDHGQKPSPQYGHREIGGAPVGQIPMIQKALCVAGSQLGRQHDQFCRTGCCLEIETALFLLGDFWKNDS
jgi:hypothetical protein